MDFLRITIMSVLRSKSVPRCMLLFLHFKFVHGASSTDSTLDFLAFIGFCTTPVSVSSLELFLLFFSPGLDAVSSVETSPIASSSLIRVAINSRASRFLNSWILLSYGRNNC